MMAMPRKSAALHELQGTKPHGESKPEFTLPPGRPKCPKNLSTDGRHAFRRICKLLESRRALTSGDGELIKVFAINFDRHVRAIEHLQTEGEVCKYTRLDSNGQPHEVEKENLWLKIAVNAEKNMVAILDRLGLSPLNRGKIKPTEEPKPAPEIDELEARLNWMPGDPEPEN
jgi:P27 family predicted phage terminase small subunit